MAIDANPAQPLSPDTDRYVTAGWFGRALNWVRDLLTRPTASPGRIYWGNGVTTRGGEAANPNDNRIQGAPLAGSGTVETLYRSAPGTAGPVAGPAGLVLLRAPIGTAPPTIGWQFVLSQGHFGGPFYGGAHSGPLEQRLTCTPGTWAPDLLGSFLYRAPQTFAYQWRRDGTEISGATAAHHTPTAPGSYTCRVTAANQAGSAAQISAAFAVSSSMLPPRESIASRRF
jgi:hypothetical protein